MVIGNGGWHNVVTVKITSDSVDRKYQIITKLSHEKTSEGESVKKVTIGGKWSHI